MSGRRDRSRESRLCTRCGRPMQWRRKWRLNWAHVRYCSRRCRHGLGEAG